MLEQPMIKSLKEGDIFVGYLLAQEVSYKTSSKGTDYLEVKLLDATGELKGLLWDLRAIEGELDSIVADAFLKIKGQLTSFNGRMQIRLDKVRMASDEEVGDFSRFFPVSKRDANEMLAELDAHINSIRDPWLKQLLQLLLVEDQERRSVFSRAPAAKSLHHVYLGGLLEHTLSVASLAEMACSHYKSINRDLVMTSVILHDLGKTAELNYQRTFGYTDEGNLLGHIVLEADWISKAIALIPSFPDELRMQILHIILAHHGKQEFGSPVPPKTPEAILVHYLDDLDGKLESVFKAMEETSYGNWSAYCRSLERMIYKTRWPETT